MENRLAEVVDKTVIMEVDAELSLCSCESDVVDETCSLGGDGACGDCGRTTKETYLEIFSFRQFYRHFVFAEDDEGNRNKRMEKYFEVSAVVDVGCGGTKEFVH